MAWERARPTYILHPRYSQAKGDDSGGDDGNGDGDGSAPRRISQPVQTQIPNAPRDQISRSGKPLTPTDGP